MFGFTLSWDEIARSSQAMGDLNTLPLELQGLTTTVTTPVIYALGTVTTVVSFAVMALTLTVVWLWRRGAADRSGAVRRIGRMRFASQPQPGQLSLFDVDESPAVPHAPRVAAAPLRRTPPPPIDAPSLLQHPRAQREIVLQGHRVAYEFRVARRRSIGFSVGLDGLSVRAPRWVRRADVEDALHERGDWILAKLAEQQQRSQRLEAARVQWREGASLPFLGEPVVLVIDPRVAGAVLDAEAQRPARRAAPRAARRPAARRPVPSSCARRCRAGCSARRAACSRSAARTSRRA